MAPSKPRLLVVGRGAREKNSTHPVVDSNDFETAHAESTQAALAHLDEKPADLVLVALQLGARVVSEFLGVLKERQTGCEVVLLGSPDEHEALADSARHAASAAVVTPTTDSRLGYELRRVLSHRDLRIEAEHLRRQVREHSAGGLGVLVGTSSAMQRVYQTVHRAASSRAPWLISGEPGVGKRVLARMLHARSRRAQGPLISFRTTGASEEDAYERLFGANGSVVAAQGGTLVIEHVQTLAPALQLGLLHVLEHHSIASRTHEPLAVDVRVVATAAADPRRDVQAGRLRDDLHERLCSVHVTMPPLRDRNNDVLVLAEHFLKRFAEEHQRLVRDFSRLARAKLAAHNWPSNVRGLEQVIESAVVQCEGTTLDASDLGFEPDSNVLGEPRVPGSTMADIERHAILQTLDSVAGSTARAAEILDVSVRTIQYRLHEYGITPKRKESRPPRA